MIRKGVYYRGKQRINLIGEWKKGFGEPSWLVTTLESEEALRIYPARMKIEECFRDLKSHLGIGQVMNKKRQNMEKMIALMLIAYALVLLIGEELRQRLYSPQTKLYFAGPFILLKQSFTLARGLILEVIHSALSLLEPGKCITVRTRV